MPGYAMCAPTASCRWHRWPSCDRLPGPGIETGRIGIELGYEQRLGIPVLELERIQAEFARAVSTMPRPAVATPDDQVARRHRSDPRRLSDHDRRVRVTFDGRAGETDRVVAERMAGAMGDAGGERPWVLITSGAGNYELATGVPSVGRSSSATWSGSTAAVRSTGSGRTSAGPASSAGRRPSRPRRRA